MVSCCQEEESDSSRVECMALNSASTSSDSESEVSEVKYFLRQNIFIWSKSRWINFLLLCGQSVLNILDIDFLSSQLITNLTNHDIHPNLNFIDLALLITTFYWIKCFFPTLLSLKKYPLCPNETHDFKRNHIL